MLDYKFLEALTAVIEEGGFDKASAKLNLTQSAVSQRIRNLEEQSGQVLIVRSVPPEPTEAGRKLIKHLRQVRLMEHELADETGLNHPDDFIIIPLGVNADSLATWLFDALDDFLHENRVLLDIYVDDENQTHELLKRGEVVGCIGTGSKQLKSCKREYLATIEYLCVCTDSFRDKWFKDGFTLKNVTKAPAAMFNRKDETQGQILNLAFPDTTITHPIFYVPSSESFIDVIRRGFAYGMVPEMQAQEDIDSGKLIELISNVRVSVPLYWQSWSVDTPLLNGLSKALVDYFKSTS
ncbi:LysR family transcriptional regulator, chromosome initiation inhibitor [Maridesulfovibrio ferrireducens]|uniref:LysR family transcriptional regulator, chromosome initiation inhibitor n=1 Tax=Maridesulfovibrio ferrireducens TaxID=246191 RepID=A0A1G9H9J0_9BACT|nr:LysR family transcriptional regulator ArgP [Maridesulfovibrio ferrireducens]SDL09547.1 LysR family transcriptional regulator, chromosome initiation inhibitor [Maridesulfovibrio ferrireducens]